MLQIIYFLNNNFFILIHVIEMTKFFYFNISYTHYLILQSID